MVERKGHFHARLVVPKKLVSPVGKTELRSPLGGDYRQALKQRPGAVARLQQQISEAEPRATAGQAVVSSPRYALAPDQLTHSRYMQGLAFDNELRNDARWRSVGIDDLLGQRLHCAIAGKATDANLSELVGDQIEWFRHAGNLDAQPGGTVQNPVH